MSTLLKLNIKVPNRNYNYFWETFFNTYNVIKEVNKNLFYIFTTLMLDTHARKIGMAPDFGKMVHNDHYDKLPTIFKKHKLTIMPYQGSSHIISRTVPYFNYQYDWKIPAKEMVFPNLNQLFNLDDIRTESAVIEVANKTGMIQDFLDEALGTKIMHQLPHLKNQRSPEFNIVLNNRKKDKQVVLQGKGIMFESDKQIQTDDYIITIETKIRKSSKDIKEGDHFGIKQLYLPFIKRYKDRSNPFDVLSMFAVYYNNCFYLYLYTFENPDDMFSIKEVYKKRYILKEKKNIDSQDITECLENVSPKENHKTYPQANSIDKVIDLVNFIHDKRVTKKELKEYLNISDRQITYYVSAAKYLDLIETYIDGRSTYYRLTKKGFAMTTKTEREKTLLYIHFILKNDIFYNLCKENVNNNVPSISNVHSYLKTRNEFKHKSEKTIHRQAESTVSWIKWIFIQANINGN